MNRRQGYGNISCSVLFFFSRVELLAATSDSAAVPPGSNSRREIVRRMLSHSHRATTFRSKP